MPHKSDARREIAWRYLRVKQPAELPALQIILVAVGESYRVLSGLCCVVPAVLTQKNEKLMAAMVLEPATAKWKLSLGLDGMQVLKVSQQQRFRHSRGRSKLLENSSVSS